MNCYKCGQELHDQAKFCPICGSAQEQNTQAQYAISQQPNVYVAQEKPKAIAALVLGIIGVIAWLLPLLGLPITIIGLVLSVKDKKLNKDYSKAAFVLNIIGLSLSSINAIIGAILGASGFLNY